jgi:hypothetical protein
MDEGNGTGDGYVKLGVEREEGVPGFVWVKRVNIGHYPVEAVFHVGDEVFGAADVCAIRMDVAERKMGGIMSEAERGVD